MTAPVIIDERKAKVVLQDGTTHYLTNLQKQLLIFLATHPGWIYHHTVLSERFTRNEDYIDDRSCASLIQRIRHKLGSRSIITVYGQGYAWPEDVPVEIIRWGDPI